MDSIVICPNDRCSTSYTVIMYYHKFDCNQYNIISTHQLLSIMSLCFRGNLAYKRLQRSTGTNHPLFVAGTTYEACLHKGTKVVKKNQEKVKLEGCVVPVSVAFPGEDCAACADINLDARYKNVGGYEWEVTFDDNYNDGERITYPLGNRADPTTSGLIPVSYRCNPTKDQKFKDEYYTKVMKKHEKKRAAPSAGAANHCGVTLVGGSPCTKTVAYDGVMCLVSLSLFHVHISYTYIYTHVITLSNTIHLPLILCLGMHESIEEAQTRL